MRRHFWRNAHHFQKRPPPPSAAVHPVTRSIIDTGSIFYLERAEKKKRNRILLHLKENGDGASMDSRRSIQTMHRMPCAVFLSDPTPSLSVVRAAVLCKLHFTPRGNIDELGSVAQHCQPGRRHRVRSVQMGHGAGGSLILGRRQAVLRGVQW